VTMLPQNYARITGKDAEQMIKLMDALDDNDDVQKVYTNADIPDEVMESL
jgi:transcriptional/translational regulatory protein YebC/TACO1